MRRNCRDAQTAAGGNDAGGNVEPYGGGSHTWPVTVEAVYQGDVPASTSVTAGVQESACGYIFDPGRYLVVAESADDGWATGSCSGTRPTPEPDVPDAERVLGPSHPPVAAPDSGAPPPPSGTGNALVDLLVALLSTLFSA